MVGNDAIRRVAQLGVLLAELARVCRSARDLLDLCEDRHEDVRIVVGAHVLEDRDETLEAHAGVDVLSGKVQLARRLAVELHEHQVPDLKHVRVIHVHQIRRVATADAIVVKFEHGPHGPVSPISQKLSLALPGSTLSSGRYLSQN